MATLISPTDLIAEGFVAEQFGNDATADWATYANGLIATAAAKLQRRVGMANYAATTWDADVAAMLKRVELCFSAADLIFRRMNRLDAEHRVGNTKERSALDDYMRQRNIYLEEAESLLATVLSSMPAVQQAVSVGGMISVAAVGVLVS